MVSPISPQIRQRSSIILPNENETIPDLSIEDNTLILPPRCSTAFPLQEKFTVPSEIILSNSELQFFDVLDGIRIQWKSSTNNDRRDIFDGGVENGLNIFFTVKETESVLSELQSLYDFLEKTLNLDFHDHLFAATPSGAKFYLLTESIDQNFFNAINSLLKTDEKQDYEYLSRCKSFDIRYEAGKDLTCLFHFDDYSEMSDTDDTIKITEKANYKQEIGILKIDSRLTTIDDIGLTGLRVVFDSSEDNSERRNKKFHKTLLHIVPRHRTYYASSQINLEKPVGLHPKLKISFNDTIYKPDNGCTLYYRQSLPKSFFIDEYTLPKNLNHIGKWSEKNIELPEYDINSWGTEYLFVIVGTNLTSFDVTLHSRYQPPDTNDTSSTHITKRIPSPHIFFSCDESKISKDYEYLNKSLFDSKFLGYEYYFEDFSSFYHFKNNVNGFDIEVPRLSGNLENIDLVTTACLLLGFFYVFIKLCNVSKIMSSSKK